MSAISFSFRPEAIPVYAQTEFLNRFFQLVLDYQYLTTPTPPSPSAQDLPMPSKFQNMEGDEPAPMKKVRKNPWADLTEEQRAERKAAMKLGRQRKAAERRQSADSLDAPAPAPAPAPEADAASETSSKKARKNPWADLTPEERAERIAKMAAGRKAKQDAKAAATLTAAADGSA
jgi:hypothetical protein